jgi:uncharacterized membrane protein YgcG
VRVFPEEGVLNLKPRDRGKVRAQLLPVVCGIAAGALVIAGLLAAAAVAADEPSGTSPREMVYAYKVWKLTDLLDLSDEQMPVFFAKLKAIDDKEAEITQGEREAAMEIGRLLTESNATDDELAQALRQLEDARAKRVAELETLRRDALSTLNVRQRCNYVVFEDRFRDEMRQMIGRAREIRQGERSGGRGDVEGWDQRQGGRGGGSSGSGGKGRR